MASSAPPLQTGDFHLDQKAKTVLTICVVSVVVALALPLKPIKLFLIAILGLTFFIVSVQRLDLGLALFVFALPFMDLVAEGSLLVPGLNLQTAGMLYFLLLGIFQSHPETGATPHKRNPVLLPLSGLLAIALFSTLYSNQSLWTNLTLIKNWFSYSLVFSFIAYKHIRSDRERWIVFLVILIAVVVNAIHSLSWTFLYQATGISLMNNRAVGPIALQPNLYGGFLAIYLLFFCSYLANHRLFSKMGLLMAGSGGLIALNLVYTLSRGSWLAFGAGAGFLMLTRAKGMLLPGLILGVCLVIWMPSDLVTARYEDSFAEEAGSRDLRLAAWSSLLPLLSTSPIVGIGYGDFREAFMRAGYVDRLRAAHSTFIVIAVEQGLVGLFFYVMTFGVVFIAAMATYRRCETPFHRTLSMGLAAAAGCVFLLDLTGARSLDANIMAYFWILTGMTLNIGSTARPEEADPKARPGQFRPA